MLKNKLFFVLLFYLAIPAFAQENFIYDAQGKRNPFIPLVTADGRFLQLEVDQTLKDAGLNLAGIIYDKYGISYAIVNDSVVKIGDYVDDYQVLKIEESKVTFIKEGQIKEVGFKKEGR